MAIDTLLEIKEHRRQALSLLCTFVRFQPPHLHQVVRTSLIDHLLQCLMIDTSTTVVSLALLSLVMFLPHIPSSLVPYLPRLFVVYSRLLCWDRYYGPCGDGTGPAREAAAPEGGEGDATGGDDDDDDDNDDDDGDDDEYDDDENLDGDNDRAAASASAAAAPSASWAYTDSRWDKLQSSFNVADATIRDLTPYYSFLYGLYPENFMGFIRKPNRYLRNARFPGLDRLDLDQDVIRQRTERYRRVHLLHPNFYNTTVENELSDLSRFMQCEPSDIVAQCMELCVSTAPPPLIPRAEVPTSQPLASKAHVATEDIPAGPQLLGKGAADEGDEDDDENDDDDDDKDDDNDNDDEDEDEDEDATAKRKKKTTTTTTTTVKEKSSPGDKASAEAGTIDSQAVDVATGRPFGLRKESQHGISRASNEMMTTATTTTTPAAEDSPTLPSTVVPPPRDGHVREMLQAHGLLRSLFQAPQAEPTPATVYDTPPTTMTTGDAPAVIARLGAYLNSLANMPDRAPTIRPGSTDVPKDMALLQREVLLLRNDLNFERFLKEQHLSHIGQLQRKHIHEATAESDTQNLIRTNRALKFRAEEARRAYSSLQKETMAGRNHSKKWENELNGRTRSLREQQKRWETEEQRLRQELHLTQDAAKRLRGLLMDSEARELGARQKLEALQSTVDELERLRDEVDTLDRRLRAYERREEEFEHARRNEEMAFTQLETARLRLQARDAERERLQKAYEDRIVELESRLRDAETATPNQTPQALQAMIDSALASSRSRFDNLRKVYNRLLTRYGELEIAYMDLQAATELDGSMALSAAAAAAAAAAASPRKLGLCRSPGELDPFGDDGQTVVEPSGSGSGSGGRRGDVGSGSGSGSDALVNGYDDYAGRSMMMRQPPPGTASYSLPSRPGQSDHLHGHMAIDMHDPGMRAVSPDTVIPSNKKHSSDGTTVSGGSVRSGSRSDSGATAEEPKKTKIKPNSGVRVYGRGESFYLSFLSFSFSSVIERRLLRRHTVSFHGMTLGLAAIISIRSVSILRHPSDHR